MAIALLGLGRLEETFQPEGPLLALQAPKQGMVAAAGPLLHYEQVPADLPLGPGEWRVHSCAGLSSSLVWSSLV